MIAFSGVIFLNMIWWSSRSLLDSYGELLQLDSKRIPGNTSVSQFADALAKAWTEYNNPRLGLTEYPTFLPYFSALAFSELILWTANPEIFFPGL